IFDDGTSTGNYGAVADGDPATNDAVSPYPNVVPDRSASVASLEEGLWLRAGVFEVVGKVLLKEVSVVVGVRGHRLYWVVAVYDAGATGYRAVAPNVHLEEIV